MNGNYNNIGRRRVYSMDIVNEPVQRIVTMDNLSDFIANSETTVLMERLDEARDRRSSSCDTLDNRLIEIYGRGSIASETSSNPSR